MHRQFWGPTTPWASDPKFREMGKYNQANMYNGVRGIGWKLLKAAGWSGEAIDQLITEVQFELGARDNHIYGLW